MNKIYLGDVEIANVGSGGGSGDYVDTSTFAEQTHAAAAALVDLKQKHNELAKLEDALQDQEEALLAEVQAVEVAKADVSAVYLKSDIDNSDKVVAAALASLDDRVSTLETSSGGGGGGSFDPTDLSTAIENLEDALLDVSTDVAGLDASVANHESRITTLENSGGGSFDPTDINSSISDISTRVSTIESDYVVSNDISTFYKNGDSLVLFGPLNTYNNKGQCYIFGPGNNILNEQYGPAFAIGYKNNVSTGSSGTYKVGIAIGDGNKSHNSYAFGVGNNVSRTSVAIGFYNTNQKDNAVVIGLNCTSGQGWSYIFGANCKTSNYYEIATGNYNNTSNVANSSTHFSVGNGAADASRHNALEINQLGEVYVADVSAAGEYYEKPMINLQQKIYELEARIAALEQSAS